MIYVPYYFPIILNEQPGETVRDGITNAMKALDKNRSEFSKAAISSGDAYDLLHSIRDVNEVKY